MKYDSRADKWFKHHARECAPNYYPDYNDSWWFHQDDIPDELPTFSTPEYPLGTILSIITMIVALDIDSRKMPKL
jgi:hypothetical protein